MSPNKKVPKKSFDVHHVELFHEENLYLPTRTVYFGGTPYTADEVDSISIAQVIKNLQILEHKKVAPISFVLNSCGGDWYSGIALYDMIKALKSEVTIIGMGQLFSMGSVIMQAGDKRVLTEHSKFMLHDGLSGYWADCKSSENWADESKNVRKEMYEIFYQQMKKKDKKITLKKIEDICSHDTIINAEKAVEIGLADEVIKGVK